MRRQVKKIAILINTLIYSFLFTCPTLSQTAHPPFSLVWSPDGTMIAGAGDGVLSIWDADSGSVLFDFPGLHGEYVYSVSWSADSTRIVTASSNQMLQIWNVADSDYSPGQELFSAQPFIEQGLLTSADWSPDGKQIAIGGVLNGPTLEIWDANTFEILGRFGAGWIESLAWRPTPRGDQSDQLAVRDFSIGIISAVAPNTTRPITLGSRSERATAMAWNSDGSQLVIGYEDGLIAVWDAATNRQLVSMTTVDAGRIRSLAWSPDDSLIASASGTVQLWKSATGSLIRNMPGVTVDFSPDGRKIVLADPWGRGIDIRPVSPFLDFSLNQIIHPNYWR